MGFNGSPENCRVEDLRESKEKKQHIAFSRFDPLADHGLRSDFYENRKAQ